MKLAVTLACLAAVGWGANALAQPAPTRTTTGTSATSDSAVRAHGRVDTSPAAGNPVTTKPAPTAAGPEDQFKDEATAKVRCPSDAIVWVNLNSKAYHASGTKYYGKTKNGAYECQKDADSDGFHAAGSKKSGAATTAATAPAR